MSHQFDEVVNLLAEYGETDLLCYRADAPVELSERQAKAWDPLLRWAKDTFGADLSPVTGVMFVEQPAQSLHHLKSALLEQSAFQLTATYDLISISGSLILDLLCARARFPHKRRGICRELMKFGRSSSGEKMKKPLKSLK